MARGGKRKGAGRPKGTGKFGEPTKAVRLPISKLDQIMEYVERLCVRTPEEFAVLPTKEKPRIPKPPRMSQMFGSAMPDDSMSPEILKGEIVLIYPQFEAKNGDTVLAYYDGRLYVRKYHLSRGGITLTPEHPKFKAIRDDAGEFDIYGVVKDKITK